MIFFSVEISWEYPHSVRFAYIVLSTVAASFVGILKFYGEFWKKVDKKDNTTCLYVYDLSQILGTIGEQSGKFFEGF